VETAVGAHLVATRDPGAEIPYWRDRTIPAEFDEGGSIGKRYRRQDEIGTPWGITVDHQTMEDDTVTLRDRDSLEQVRVPIEGLADELATRLAQPWQSPKLG
jgi:glycyl-tRNA synthetase